MQFIEQILRGHKQATKTKIFAEKKVKLELTITRRLVTTTPFPFSLVFAVKKMMLPIDCAYLFRFLFKRNLRTQTLIFQNTKSVFFV